MKLSRFNTQSKFFRLLSTHETRSSGDTSRMASVTIGRICLLINLLFHREFLSKLLFNKPKDELDHVELRVDRRWEEEPDTVKLRELLHQCSPMNPGIVQNKGYLSLWVHFFEAAQGRVKEVRNDHRGKVTPV